MNELEFDNRIAEIGELATPIRELVEPEDSLELDSLDSEELNSRIKKLEDNFIGIFDSEEEFDNWIRKTNPFNSEHVEDVVEFKHEHYTILVTGMEPLVYVFNRHY